MSGAEQSEHIDENNLDLYLKDQLSDPPVSTVETHLRGCQMCVDKLAERDKCLWYFAELSSDEFARDGERRRQPRVATNDPASLQVLSPFSAGFVDVRIVDVSKTGLRTHTPQELMPGSLIKLKMQYSVACGDVRYCIPADNGFYAGVRLHDYFGSPAGTTSDPYAL